MSGPLSNPFMFKSAAGATGFYTHQIANSARYNQSASAHMYRTNGTATNEDKCTMSAWVKRTKLGSHTAFTGAYDPAGWGGGYLTIGMENGDNFKFLHHPSSNAATQGQITSDALYRDSSAFYHVVVAYDSSQGTAANRVKIYINGSQVTDITATTYPDQNQDFILNKNGCKIFIGSGGDSGGGVYQPWDGYIAEYVMIDGTAYAASDFGETKNGVWIPKDPSGLTFGNNGVYCKFESSSDLGNDSSGNNNDFTVSNVSAHDQMLDTPTFNSSSNGGNFATLGGLEKNTGGFTISEGNLKYAVSTNNRGFIASTGVPESGKYYWEVRVTQFGGSEDGIFLGVCEPDKMRGNLTASGRGGAEVSGAGGYTVDNYNGRAMLDGVAQSSDSIGTARSVPQTFGIAIDRDNNTFKWTYDGSTYSSTYTIPSTGVLAPYIGSGGGGNTASGVFNFGADSTFAGLVTAGGNADGNGYGNFSLAVPSGYVALCAANLPVADAVDPAQTDDDYPQKLFGMLQYTGNGSERTIDTSFQIDWSWARSTVQGQNWHVLDTNRGFFGASSNNLFLELDTNDAEDTFSQYNFKAQSGSDITITSGTAFNSGTHTQQMWNWRLNGGTTSTNSSGSVSVTQQVDPSGHLSISTYSGAGGTGTFGHGLSGVPTMVWVKQRNGANNWAVYAKGAGNTKYGYLDRNTAFGTAALWNNTTPSSTLVSVGDTNEVNHSGRTYVAYCFADCDGYIKSGKYVGNGDVDGPFIYLGFKPALFIIKHVSSGDDPLVWDSLNGPINPISKTLSMHDNSAIVDNSNRHVDFLSNGVKIRTTNSNANSTNSDGIVYLAMAHNPFKYATAR